MTPTGIQGRKGSHAERPQKGPYLTFSQRTWPDRARHAGGAIGSGAAGCADCVRGRGNLLLARGAVRQREVAQRTALGARAQGGGISAVVDVQLIGVMPDDFASLRRRCRRRRAYSRIGIPDAGTWQRLRAPNRKASAQLEARAGAGGDRGDHARAGREWNIRRTMAKAGAGGAAGDRAIKTVQLTNEQY